MKQHRIENFSVSVLEEGEKSYHEILERERTWIVQLNSVYPSGYNTFCSTLSDEDAAIIRYNAYNSKGTEYAALLGLSAGTIYQIRATKPGCPYAHSDRSCLPADITAYALHMGHVAAMTKIKGENWTLGKTPPENVATSSERESVPDPSSRKRTRNMKKKTPRHMMLERGAQSNWAKNVTLEVRPLTGPDLRCYGRNRLDVRYRPPYTQHFGERASEQ